MERRLQSVTYHRDMYVEREEPRERTREVVEAIRELKTTHLHTHREHPQAPERARDARLQPRTP